MQLPGKICCQNFATTEQNKWMTKQKINSSQSWEIVKNSQCFLFSFSTSTPNYPWTTVRLYKCGQTIDHWKCGLRRQTEHYTRAWAGGGGGVRDTDRTQLRSWENKNSPAGPGRREVTAGQTQADMMELGEREGTLWDSQWCSAQLQSAGPTTVELWLRQAWDVWRAGGRWLQQTGSHNTPTLQHCLQTNTCHVNIYTIRLVILQQSNGVLMLNVSKQSYLS